MSALEHTLGNTPRNALSVLSINLEFIFTLQGLAGQRALNQSEWMKSCGTGPVFIREAKKKKKDLE